MNIAEIIGEVTREKSQSGGINSIYFIACGGSLTAFYPADYFLKSEAKWIRSGYYTSNEFVHATPKAFGENAIAVLCSHRGNTPETVEAAKLSRSLGATTVALTYSPDSPITKHADYVVGYEWGPDSRVDCQKPSMGLQIAVELLKQVEGYSNYDKFVEGFGKLNELAVKAEEQIQRRAEQFAEEYKDEELIYTMGSGASYGSAHQEAICSLLEMQWIHSSSMHSGEYFHGPFEITDENVPFILLISEGRTRSLDERALAFLRRYGKKIITIDTRELGINMIDDSVVEFFNPLLHTNILGVYNEKLAVARNHPLTHRRYMWKVEY